VPVPSIESVPAFEVEIQQRSENDTLLCLDVPGPTSDPINLQGFPCHGGPNQRWILNFFDPPFCKIFCPLTEKCLDIPNGDVGYVPVQQYFNSPGGLNQQWLLHSTYDVLDPSRSEFEPSGLQILARADQNWMLSFNPDYGNRLELTDRGRTVLQFVVHPIAEWLWIINDASRLYLDVPFSSTEDGVQVQQFPVDIPYQDNQRWQFEPSDPGYFLIRNKHSQMYLTAERSDFSDPVSVIQRNATGSDLQKWRLVLTSNGAVQIISRQNRCLGIMDNANLLQAQRLDGRSSQTWRLDHVHADL
jgi:Ricin-type beta-trefoil lectin domain-like